MIVMFCAMFFCNYRSITVTFTGSTISSLKRTNSYPLSIDISVGQLGFVHPVVFISLSLTDFSDEEFSARNTQPPMSLRHHNYNKSANWQR